MSEVSSFPLDAEDEPEPLTWDSSYAIALALHRAHAQVDLLAVSLGMIYQWTLELPAFADDPQLANEGILAAIYQDWFEEVISR